MPAAKVHELFQALQKKFSQYYKDIFFNDLADKTVVIVPSLTLDQQMLQSITGHIHYEERMLCMLMLLRMPRTKVIYVSSVPIDSGVIDYYLHLLPGITGYHARQRLHLFSCYDGSAHALTNKILCRPRLIRRIKEQIGDANLAHMVCFNVTEAEEELSALLDIPIYGCDSSLLPLGTKSGCRTMFKKLGIPMPEGYENIHTVEGLVQALADLKKQKPLLRKAVIKMNDGFSGDGNAVFSYLDIGHEDADIVSKISESLPRTLKIVAAGMTYDTFIRKFTFMGGIVEEFIDGEWKVSPSVQCRINPLGISDVISTHDQVMGGESGQVFLGATFPASGEYSRDIAALGLRICRELQEQGVLGRFSIDFLSVREAGGWVHYAIEINLRKGGTTHPYLMLQFLTDGEYDMNKGLYMMPNGQTRCYFASDNVVSDKYKGLTPHDLIDIAMCNRLMYDGAKQSGVMFHMIGALSQYGKLGVVCIGHSPEEAKGFFDKTIAVLDKSCMGNC